MKNIILMIEIIAISLTLASSSVLAAEGTVSWKNPPEKLGKVKRDDDGSNRTYVFQIPKGLEDPTEVPDVGDVVTFTTGRGQTARDVALKPSGTGGGGG